LSGRGRPDSSKGDNQKDQGLVGDNMARKKEVNTIKVGTLEISPTGENGIKEKKFNTDPFKNLFRG